MTDRSKTDAHERRFPNTAALFETLARDITDALQAGLASGRGASLIVPGGRTPVALFELLSGAELDWDDVWISVGDERWVDTHSVASNEKLVRDHLLKGAAAGAHFVALKNQAADARSGAHASWS